MMSEQDDDGNTDANIDERLVTQVVGTKEMIRVKS